MAGSVNLTGVDYLIDAAIQLSAPAQVTDAFTSIAMGGGREFVSIDLPANEWLEQNQIDVVDILTTGIVSAAQTRMTAAEFQALVAMSCQIATNWPRFCRIIKVDGEDH